MRSANGGDISTERESSDSSATSSEVCPANEEVEADVGGAVPAEQDGEGGGEDLEGDIDGFVLSHVRLPQGRTVPNCCAVCLCPYEDGDSLVFSSNEECRHAFHDDCLVQWLGKMQDGTPCPCCRQTFVHLSDHRVVEEDGSDHSSGARTFNISVVSI